jgi:hypothetical protein
MDEIPGVDNCRAVTAVPLNLWAQPGRKAKGPREVLLAEAELGDDRSVALNVVVVQVG